MPNPDPLADAKAALASANKFQNSTGGTMSKSAPAAATPASKSSPEPSLGDELEAKRSNVDSYRKAYVQNYKARNAQ